MLNIASRRYLTPLLLLFHQHAIAGYAGSLAVTRLYVADNGWAYFGTTTQPPGTCSFWGEYWKFDSTSPGGKGMLSVLISAKLGQKKIDVWYHDTAVSGTDQTNGCNSGSVSTATHIGVR